MINVNYQHGLILSGVLFLLGVIGLLSRRNILYMLMSIEIMLNAAALAFITGGSRWASADGQVMFIVILSTAAAEVAVGLALVLQFYHHYKTLDADSGNRMRDRQ